jgi:hypothetical protein
VKTTSAKKPSRVTPAQAKARLEAHQPSWTGQLLVKLNRLSFPSLTQGAEKFTEGKQLAGCLSILRHNDPQLMESPIEAEKQKNGSVRHKLVGKGCTCIMAEVGRRLVRAILDRDTQFLNDFRKASKHQDPRRDVYLWMLSNSTRVESCHTKGQILRLAKAKFPSRVMDERNFYTLLSEIGLPLCKPSK